MHCQRDDGLRISDRIVDASPAVALLEGFAARSANAGGDVNAASKQIARKKVLKIELEIQERKRGDNAAMRLVMAGQL